MFAAFDNFPALLIWLPLIGGLISFFIKDERSVKAWAMLSSLLTLALFAVSLLYTDDKNYILNSVSYVWLPELGSSFSLLLDGMSRILCLLTAIAFPLIFASTYSNSYKKANAFYGLMLLTQCGLMGVFLSVDALVFYFFWELALIPAYFLASQWGGEKRVQAAFKFFIYTFAGSLFLLIGIIYVYLKTPEQSFSLVSFYNVQLSAPEQMWLFWMFFVAFAIKMPIFPFHTWQPDVYEQSPTAVTMVLSGIMVKMGLFAAIRWLLPIFPDAVKHYDNVVIGLAVVGMLYASCIALVQDDLKRLIAYSSIAHIGLMAASLFTINQLSMQGALIQMFNHGVNIIGLWIVVYLIEKQTGIRKISQLGGLAQKAPTLAILLVVIALANIALPLTNAFVGEFMMFAGLYKFSAWYAAAAGLSIILAAIYTLNMVKNVFYGNLNAITAGFKDIVLHERVVLVMIVVMIFIVGVYPEPMFNMIRSASELVIGKFIK
ncbi:MAG TPA: NADH-quinone oxidoreductase subunit M [Chitinophagaceae bacterium]|nr:NADH-quinone oxidoreductase subunit M [Chitinophagaceae bacterium]